MLSKTFISLSVLLTFLLYQIGVSGKEFHLEAGHARQLIIPTKGVSKFSVSGFKNGTTLMLQLHSQITIVTLCTSPNVTSDTCKYGNNIGVYATMPAVGNATVLWYVTVNSTYSDVTVVSYLHLFMNKDPLPGGCNQIFNLKNDPNILVTSIKHQTRLLFQWANLLASHEVDCDSSSVQSKLEYDIYVYYLDSGSFGQQDFLDGVSKMMAIYDIAENGQLVTTVRNEETSKPEVFLASEYSRGIILSVVARSMSTGLSAQYVSTVTYNCNIELGDCTSEVTAGQIIVIIVCFLVGLYLLVLGHRMFYISQFVFGYTLTFILVFLLMHMAYAVHKSVIYGIAGCVGVLGGILCLLFWNFCFFPIASVMIPGLCAGYLVGATLFFTPFGNISWWETNENYILAFICIALLYSVLLMAYTKFLSILSSSLMGAYMLLMVLGIPLHTSLRFVYLYSEYRQTEAGFENVKLVPPMSAIDITSLALWPVFLISGMVFQYYRERGRPAFERFDLKKKTELIRRSLSPGAESDRVYDTDTDVTDGESDETERSHLLPSPVRPNTNSSHLIGKPRPPSYQSVQDAQDSPRRMREIC